MKIFRLVLVCCLIPLLTGCMLLNCWIIKGDGKGLGGSYQMISGKADNMDVIGMRYLLLTDQKMDKKTFESLLAAKITVGDDNKIKTVSFGPVTNFEPKNTIDK